MECRRKYRDNNKYKESTKSTKKPNKIRIPPRQTSKYFVKKVNIKLNLKHLFVHIHHKLNILGKYGFCHPLKSLTSMFYWQMSELEY